MCEQVGCIYLLWCEKSGKGYVGQHNNVLTVEKKRWREHVYAAVRASKKSECAIHRAVRKYGAEAFTVRIVWRGPVATLNEKECYYIRKYRTFKDDTPGGYNLTTGGGNGQVVSEATRRRHSESLRGKAKSREVRAKYSVAQKRRFAAPENRTYLSKPRKPLTEEQRAAISERTKLLWEDPVYRAGMVASIKRANARPEFRAHMSAIMTNCVRSEEFCRKSARTAAARKRGADGKFLMGRAK